MIFFASSLNFVESPSTRLALRFAFLFCPTCFLCFLLMLFCSVHESIALIHFFVQKRHNVALNVVNFEIFG